MGNSNISVPHWSVLEPFFSHQKSTHKLSNHDGRFFLAIDTQPQLDRRRYEGTMLSFDGVRLIYGWAIFYRHRGWYKFQRRVRCICKPTNSTRIIVCANISSMDNATVATIVADIVYMSKAAEGAFICHEDPTSSAISCVDIWYAQKIFRGKTYTLLRLKPVDQIVHSTLIDCGIGSNELIYTTINYKFMHESVC